MKDPEVGRKQAIAASTFLKELSSESLNTLLESAMYISLPEGTVIYRPGEESQTLLIESGEGRMWIGAADGRRMVVRHFGPGEIIGLVASLGGPAELTVETILPTTALAIPGERIRSVAASHSDVGYLFATQCALRVYGLMDELHSMTFDPVSRRLARCLIRLSRGASSPVNIRITQQELADTIATSREVVTRTLKDFKDSGLVSTQSDSPGLLFIKNPEGLQHYYREASQ